ncbi:MAG: hypothetical protein ACTSU5_15545 [Promethearchaeota archaeon]
MPRKSKILEMTGGERAMIMAVMPIRGPKGFRKLDYEWASDPTKLNIPEIVEKCYDAGFNGIGVVIKDTDGASLWDTEVGWNPTGRDILGEFVDACNDHGDTRVIGSITTIHDAYQGHLHPDRVASSWHGKLDTHLEGEMRVDVPEGSTWEDVKEKIPFLTDKFDGKVGAARGSRGQGYIPETSFLCPNSRHLEYLEDLTYEVVRKYPKMVAILADYIRYDHVKNCYCKRCQREFYRRTGSTLPMLAPIRSAWMDFREDNVAAWGARFHAAVKRANPDCYTGAFILPMGPYKPVSRAFLGQSWWKLGSILDFLSPMVYPYLMGTIDDGAFWRTFADVNFAITNWIMKKRAMMLPAEILSITNSVECNPEEMLISMKRYDYGKGVGLFKYYGTTEAQWRVLKKYIKKVKPHPHGDAERVKYFKPPKDWDIYKVAGKYIRAMEERHP